jgi:homoserine acetyltransferase
MQKLGTILFILVGFLYGLCTDNTTSHQLTGTVEGDYVVKDFKFKSGETLPELKLHYRTIGTPTKDANGVVRNAVLIMHGTGGTGAQFLSRSLATFTWTRTVTRCGALLHHIARRHWSWRLK